MLQANHYDMDMIRDCAEKVASHWQQLMLKMEDRLKLVNASVAFYKTSEQVGAPAYAPRGPTPSGNSVPAWPGIPGPVKSQCSREEQPHRLRIILAY